ncbi:MAG: ecotin family protein [Pseudomonadota bacterium]|nr:ecotin family protein [Pseudomonadota bacterium]
MHALSIPRPAHRLAPRLAAPLLAALCLAACAQTTPSTTPAPGTSAPRPIATGDALAAFPASLPGHQRHVVKLPPLEDEQLHRVELQGGKTMPVDCNRHGMDGMFSQREVPGHPYAYWVFASRGEVMSTRMGCPDDSRRRQFVGAEPLLVPYNSRVPVVVFVPEGFEFRWRTLDSRTAQLRNLVK